MPRTLQDIIDHADELADRFEHAEPGQLSDGAPLRVLVDLVEQRGRTEAAIGRSVAEARTAGIPWSALGAVIGTSGEAVRQRYGTSDGPARMVRAGSTRGLVPAKARKEVKKVVTGKRDASAAAKQLKSKSSSKAQKSVAASDLAQARRKSTATKKK